MNTREFLGRRVLSRDMVDRFLEPEKYRVADTGSEIGNLDAENITTFEADVGYLFSKYVGRDGLDGSYNLASFSPSGERKMLNFAERPCRINTYGNSFTQCAQVNDGETWQEVLAAHLGEPIRNFGVGGYGVFQAFKRMLQKESTEVRAENIILNIWSDDHFRNIFEWRGVHYENYGGFSGPWAYLRLDLRSGEFEERPNPHPTPESLYLMCDADHVYETYKDAFEVVATMAREGVVDVQTDILRSAGEVLGLSTDFTSPESTAATATELLRIGALRSSMYVLDRLTEFARQEGKNVLVLLSFSPRDVVSACTSGGRFDREFLHYLAERDALYVDTLEKHVQDFQMFRGTPEEYAEQFYIGHYNPHGNHFFAYAVKDAIVEWLDPKPPTYRAGGEAVLELLDPEPAEQADFQEKEVVMTDRELAFTPAHEQARLIAEKKLSPVELGTTSPTGTRASSNGCGSRAPSYLARPTLRSSDSRKAPPTTGWGTPAATPGIQRDRRAPPAVATERPSPRACHR